MPVGFRNALFLLIPFILSAAAPPAPGSYAITVQKILGLETGNDDYLGPLAAAVKQTRANPEGKETYDALDALVRALNSKTDADALDRMIMGHLKVSEYFKSFELRPDWKYGTHTEIAEMAQRLFELAGRVHERDAHKGEQYARAAILLDSMLYYKYKTSGTRIMMMDIKAFQTTSGLSDEQLKAIKDLVAARDKAEQGYFDKLNSALRSEDALIKAKGASLPVEQINGAMDGLSAMWSQAQGEDDQYQTIWLAWECRSLAIIRQDKDFAGRLEALVKSWMEKDQPEEVKGWLAEALGAIGPMPVSHIRVVQDK